MNTISEHRKTIAVAFEKGVGKGTKMYRTLFSLFVIFNAVLPFIAGERGCPPEEDIAPCRCIRKPAPRLTCNRIFNSDILLRVFTASERYTFQEVHINDSAFLYIPVEIFAKSYIKELYLNNSAFNKVFDESLEWINLRNDFKHPNKVQIENTKVMRGFLSTNFSTFTNLTELIVKSSFVGNLPVRFSSSLPSGLKQLSFSANEIKNIRPGALTLPNLDKFSLERNRVKNITRAIFPKPFNVRILKLDFNLIESIPHDMFHDMPNLQFLSMQNNLITTIPEAAFHGRISNVPIFRFDGNPLQCDCEILWIIKNKPEILGGSCTSPEEFRGKALNDLTPSAFAC